MRLGDLLDEMVNVESLYGQTVRFQKDGADKYALSQSRMEVLQYLQKNCDKNAVYHNCDASDEWFKARLDAVVSVQGEDRTRMLKRFKRELDYTFLEPDPAE